MSADQKKTAPSSSLTTTGEIWQVLKTTCVEWWNDGTFRLAAALAFYTIFSLVPVLLLVVNVASLFLARETATQKIVAEFQRMLGNNGAQAIKQMIHASSGFGKSASAITTGVVAFLLGASAAFAELQAALNKIWDVQREAKRGIILKLILDRLRSFALAFGVGFLLLVSLVISAMLTALRGYSSNWMPEVPVFWQAANVSVSFLAVGFLFAMVYKYLPDAKITWRNVWIGAAVTAALFILGKYVIGLYFGQRALGSAFGAAGSFAVLLIWIYYSALICFFGAEFTQVYARRQGGRILPKGHARRVGNKD